MEIKLTLSDSDVIFMDDFTGDIKLSRDVFPEELSQGETVTIHFKEDSANVDHVYHVSTMSDLENTVDLAWKKQVNKTLTEANPLNIFKKKTGDELISKNIEKSEKQDKKDALKGARLVARDMSPEAKDNTFYLQNPDGSYQKGIRQSEAKSIYTKLGAEHPSIANAVVLTPMNYIYRKGMQDLRNSGSSLDPNDLNKVELLPSFSKDWPEEDVKKYEAAKKRKERAAAKKQASSSTEGENAGAKEETSAQEEPTSSAKTSLLTKPVVDKFKKLAMATGLQLVDAYDKPVNTSSAMEIGKITTENVADYVIKINGKDYNLFKWLEHAVKNKVITENLEESKMTKILIESPVLQMDDEDMMDPKEFSIRGLINKAQVKESEKLARMTREAAEAELKKTYDIVMPKFKASISRGDLPEKTLEILFDELVPSSGPAASVGGEMVRAMMRILFRDYNDGDKFFEGYGLETCASSAEYLFDNGFADDIQHILDNAYYLEDDARYTDAINNLAEKVVNRIKEDNSLIYTINETDSRDYSTDYIKENQPTYDIEISGSDDIVNLVENGVLNAWDLNEYVEHVLSYENYFEGSVVDRPWSHDSTNVSVSNLTRDGYDELENRIQNNLDGFWADLVAEHADELTNDYDDDYEEEQDDE